MIFDRIKSWLNRRDVNDVKADLEIEDTFAAEKDPNFDAAKRASANEVEAKRLIAAAKAHEREIDVAESDSDDWGPPGWTPPERREREVVLASPPEDLTHEGQVEAQQ